MCAMKIWFYFYKSRYASTGESEKSSPDMMIPPNSKHCSLYMLVLHITRGCSFTTSTTGP
jgi:hypothetical protein